MDPVLAIDFETGDAKRDSACAVGVARIENATVVATRSALIRPPRPILAANHMIHGITWDDVRDAPTFEHIWLGLADLADGCATLVAHNAAFDRSVLEACCKAANIPPPRVAWDCTLARARKLWPAKTGAPNTLAEVCRRLGIDRGVEHEAGSDALAAAKVWLTLTGAKPEVVAYAPSGPNADILALIPVADRTEAVVALMKDHEALSPAHAHDLVRAVAANVRCVRPGDVRCRQCGKPATFLCQLCRECSA